MKLNYKPSVRKGATHSLEIDNVFFKNTYADNILKFARPLLTKYEFKQLQEAVRIKEPLVINDSGTVDSFEYDLHAFITTHPYFKSNGRMLLQSFNEVMKAKYIVSAEDPKDSIVIKVEPNPNN